MYDASLDAFVKHDWNFNLPGRGQRYSSVDSWDGFSFGIANFNTHQKTDIEGTWFGYSLPRYDDLKLFGVTEYSYYRSRGMVFDNEMNDDLGDLSPVTVVASKYAEGDGRRSYAKSNVINYLDAAMEQVPGVQMQEKDKPDEIRKEYFSAPFIEMEIPIGDPEISPRKNLQETAFFYPTVETDAEGNFVLKFTVPEALTRWKFQGFAHTQALDYGLISKETITQKELMVFPNAPRFLREGDTIVFSAKVSNLSETRLPGMAGLQLFDAGMQPIDAQFMLANASQPITMGKGQNAVAVGR